MRGANGSIPGVKKQFKDKDLYINWNRVLSKRQILH